MSYLDYLADVLSCDYLSDLHLRNISASEARQLLAEAENYPEKEYAEAARYLLGEDYSFTTVQAARRAIVAKLQGIESNMSV